LHYSYTLLFDLFKWSSIQKQILWVNALFGVLLQLLKVWFSLVWLQFEASVNTSHLLVLKTKKFMIYDQIYDIWIDKITIFTINDL
jgi:hypothetical protein